MTVTSEGGSGGHRGSPFGQPRGGEGRWRPSGLGPPPRGSPGAPCPRGDTTGAVPCPLFAASPPLGPAASPAGLRLQPPRTRPRQEKHLKPNFKRQKKNQLDAPQPVGWHWGGLAGGFPWRDRGAPRVPGVFALLPRHPLGPHPRLCPKGICNTPPVSPWGGGHHSILLFLFF